MDRLQIYRNEAAPDAAAAADDDDDDDDYDDYDQWYEAFSQKAEEKIYDDLCSVMSPKVHCRLSG